MKYKIGDKVIYKNKETVICAITRNNQYIVEYSFGWNYSGEKLLEGKLSTDTRYHYASDEYLKFAKSKSEIVDTYSIY